jgi:hypothetical protein
MADYTCCYGTRSPNAAPVETYQELIGAPARYGPDDGAVILHAGDMLPRCVDCQRGHLEWSEARFLREVLAGHEPWHRICDVCGSQWRLHPLVWGVTRLDDGSPARWVDGRGFIPFEPSEPIGESGKAWGDFLTLTTPEMWLAAAAPERRAQMANSVTVTGCWARSRQLLPSRSEDYLRRQGFTKQLDKLVKRIRLSDKAPNLLAAKSTHGHLPAVCCGEDDLHVRLNLAQFRD